MVRYCREEFMMRYAFPIAVMTLIFSRLSESVADPDLWGYLAFGRLFWTRPDFPYQDVFAYVPTLNSWVYHEWLTGVLFYPLYIWRNGTGLQMVKYAIAVFTIVLILRTAKVLTISNLAIWSGLLLISPVFEITYSPVRAQIFSQLGFAAVLLILEKSRSQHRHRLIWALPPIFLLWHNFHGGVLVGMGICGIFFLVKAIENRTYKEFLGMLLLSLVLLTANPYGVDYLRYLIPAVTMPRPEIIEWASVPRALANDVYDANIYYFLFLTILSFFLLVWCKNRDLFTWIVLGVTALFAFRSVRHQGFFFIAAGIYLPQLLLGSWQRLFKNPAIQQRWQTNASWVISAIAGVLLITSIVRLIDQPILTLRIQEPDYPVGALAYLDRYQPKGNIVSEFDWGEILLWRFTPDLKVGMDGRYETVYPSDISSAFFDFIEYRPNWKLYLTRFPPDLILVRRSRTILKELRKDPQWTVRYEDPTAVLMSRMPPHEWN